MCWARHASSDQVPFVKTDMELGWAAQIIQNNINIINQVIVQNIIQNINIININNVQNNYYNYNNIKPYGPSGQLTIDNITIDIFTDALLSLYQCTTNLDQASRSC